MGFAAMTFQTEALAGAAPDPWAPAGEAGSASSAGLGPRTKALIELARVVRAAIPAGVRSLKG